METYGCAANQAESEIMGGLLDRAGFHGVGSPREADLIIVNTCGVKSPTENKIIERLRRLSRLDKPLVVAGCLTRINWRRLVREVEFAVAITPYSIHRIVEAAEIAMEGGSLRLLLDSGEPPDKPALQTKMLYETIGTIIIEDGCNFGCSFCATRFARGFTHSYPPVSILEAVKRLVSSGAIEVRLTGQDVAAYRYGGMNLPGLVQTVVGEVPGDYRVRVGMMTPVFADRIKEGLVRMFKGRKVYKFAHIPAQSGSDRVLTLMRRGHGVDLFEALISFLRREVDRLTVATDIIVGHPGEEEEDFELTLKLLERTEPDIVNLSKYGNRPGTPASRMVQVPTDIISRRSRIAYEVALRIMERRNSSWVGWEGDVKVVKMGRKLGTLIARNDWYKPIVVKGERDLLGKTLNVIVEGYTPVRLDGRVSGGR